MLVTDVRPEQATGASFAVEYPSRKREIHGEGPPAFTFSVTDEAQLQRILTGNARSAALAFIHGRFSISGDLVAALRLRQAHSRTHFVDSFWSLAARFAPRRIETWFQGRKRAGRNIRFHYDISNHFYQKFLDSRLVYSEALFEDPSWSLEDAQKAKLRRICDDLDLHPGERFLDVGCGWGALLVYAAECYKVNATGCTLSHSQYEFAESLIEARRLERYASVHESDYRDLTCCYDKIASIGMFEHVGRHRLLNYFQKMYRLLDHGGLFLNSGIVRPDGVKVDPETWFLLTKVFPGGELCHLSEVVRAAERAGFRLIKIESRRKDYARTCAEWVARLQRNDNICTRLVGLENYRTWLLYLAASSLNFETGQTDVFSIVMSKR